MSPHDLITRAHLFGNPTRALAKISPDGRHLAWLAPVDGVLNVWVSPFEAPQDARPVTDDRKRGIRMYGWTYDDRHLVYLQDQDGDENHHLYAIELGSGVARELTPFSGTKTWVARISRVIRDRLLGSLNRRDARFHDLYTVDLASGNLALVEENPGSPSSSPTSTTGSDWRSGTPRLSDTSGQVRGAHATSAKIMLLFDI